MTLDEIDKLCEAATSGPWEWDRDGDVFSITAKEYWKGVESEDDKFIGTTRFFSAEQNDAQFIAASRTIIPELVKRVRELEEEVKAWRETSRPG